MIASELFCIIVTVLLGAALGWLLIHLTAGPDPPALPQLAIRRDSRGDERLFKEKTWRKGKRIPAARRQPGTYNRPADIDIPEDRVADPPRVVQGRNGE
jgi:hypothetical protein